MVLKEGMVDQEGDAGNLAWVDAVEMKRTGECWKIWLGQSQQRKQTIWD